MAAILSRPQCVKHIEQNGRHFADNTFKCILLNEDNDTVVQISLMFVAWANDEPDLWCHMALLGHIELTTKLGIFLQYYRGLTPDIHELHT